MSHQGLLKYPMISTASARCDDYWREISGKVIGRQYDHASLANKKDDIYSEFLKSMKVSSDQRPRGLFRKNYSIDENAMTDGMV